MSRLAEFADIVERLAKQKWAPHPGITATDRKVLRKVAHAQTELDVEAETEEFLEHLLDHGISSTREAARELLRLYT